jgi:hypothetical protein
VVRQKPAAFRIRFLVTFAIAFALIGIGEKFPFSPFPMYANVEPTADVLYVTDDQNRPLALSSIFGVGSAQAKKRFEKELQILTKTRDYEKAAPELLAQAGATFLTTLWKDRKASKLPAEPLQGLQAWILTISAAPEGGFRKETHPVGKIKISSY